MKISTCIACGSNEVEKAGSYRPFALKGMKASIKSFLVRHPWLMTCSRIKSLEKYRDFPVRGSLVRCRACALVYLGTMPTLSQLERFYAADYWSMRRPDMSPGQYRTSPRAHAQVEFITGLLPKPAISSVLEIGAGTATPSLLLREKLSPFGDVVINVIEPGSIWKDYYHQTSINVIGTFFPIETDKTFSHIHASHWLEHNTDPKDTVQRMRRILDKNGTVFIEVPYASDEYWTYKLSDIPHTLFFSIESLNSLFTQSGFNVLGCGRYGISLREWEQGRWPTDQEFARENPEGFWIRALYQKEG